MNNGEGLFKVLAIYLYKTRYIMGKLKQLSNLVKYSFYLIALAIVFGVSFNLGRKSVKMPQPKEKIEYIKGETIHDSIFIDKPYKVTPPLDTLNLIKACIEAGIYKELWPKEVVKEYLTKEDTSAIIRDWATERRYSETLFNDEENGKLSFDASVKYNKLASFDYQFVPTTKKVITKTVYKQKDFSPFVGLGTLINPWDESPDMMAQVTGGFFIRDKYGVQMQYQRGYKSNNDYLGGTILFKF